MSVGFFEPETKTIDALETLLVTCFKEGRFICREGDDLSFGDAKCIGLIDYLQKSHTINREYYAYLLMQLRKAMKTKCSG